MTIAKNDINYIEERLKLRQIYESVSPRQRLGVIRKRLLEDEIGATKLITVVSAVEGLARCLVVHLKTNDPANIINVYRTHRKKDPESLVAEFFKLSGIVEPKHHFTDDTWPLFREAIEFRNLVVHECTYLGQDKYPSLISSTLEVLEEMIRIGKL